MDTYSFAHGDDLVELDITGRSIDPKHKQGGSVNILAYSTPRTERILRLSNISLLA